MISGRMDPYLSLRERVVGLLKAAPPREEFWALRDVQFNIEEGDTLGIVGRNGAGKSTLLKILSRITPPTKGKIVCRGRIASLLEVGTGFHPELTGRENVFLNGSILGMRKVEIQRKFEAIVDFSGVEKFIDTPLKFYSSGMQLRLAFAVAAFLENEILVIDEVLAVGDSEFQKKCMGKMENISRAGRTIIFVSHNAAALKSLCRKGVLLEKGIVERSGNINEVLDHYHSTSRANETGEVIFEKNSENGNENIRLISLSVNPGQGEVLSVTSGIKFELRFYCNCPNINLDSTWELRNDEDLVIFHSGALISTNNDSKVGMYTVAFSLDANTLNADNYHINLIFGKNQREPIFVKQRCYTFALINDLSSGSNYSDLPGVLRPNLDFKVKMDAH
jgi:lipopolysaccharide transport system ATP-binding protein